MMQIKITYVFVLFFTFLIGGKLHSQSTSTCKKFTVATTQNLCGCVDNRWSPYVMAIGTPQSSCSRNLFKPQSLTFQQNSNGTASLSGTLRNSSTWQLAVINITLTDGSASGTPNLELCNTGKSSSIASDWSYYAKAQGTIQLGNAAPLSIKLNSKAFQIGKGANGQNTTLLGGSGAFILNDSTTLYFNFNLNNEQACDEVPDNNDGNSNVISCDSIKFTTTNNAIGISNVNSPNADVQIFDKNWKKIYSCSGSNCKTTRLTNLPAGDYIAKIKLFSNDPWVLICQSDYRLKVTSDSSSTNPCSQDSIAPKIACPANITASIPNATDTCVKVNWAAPLATDNCGTPLVSSTSTPNSCFGIGTTKVTYTAKDSAGNKASCSFNITVSRVVVNPCAKDTIAPSIKCPDNINTTLANNNDPCVKVNWATPIATDNCSAPSVTSTFKPNECFSVGANLVFYTATDSAGNVSNCSFMIIVNRLNPCANDTIAPSITCPANVTATIINAADTCINVTWADPKTVDNCTVPTLSSNFKPNSCLGSGIYTVMYTATDAAGNKATCQFTATIKRNINPCLNDTIKPTITCPANITAEITKAADTCIAVKWTTPLATDNCTTIPSVSSNYKSDDCFSVGTKTVIYTAADSTGNKATCQFTITVKRNVNPCLSDTTKPTITCPANITAEITKAADTCIAVQWTSPVAADNCTATPSISSNYKSGDCFSAGTKTVIYTATDSTGNKATCQFTITVKRNVNPCLSDTTKPTITCPANIKAEITKATDTCVAVTWTAPTASDNCTATPSVSSNLKPNDCLGVGIKTVIYTATDSTGNKATCQFTVTVINADTCQIYDAKESNLNCNCSDPVKRYTPYFIYMGSGPDCNVMPSNTFDIRFKKDNNGTASITGNGRDSAGNLIVLDLRLSGFTRTGTPNLELCNDTSKVPSNTWYYYTSLTGTVQFGILGTPTSVSLNNGVFQIGIGADGQNTAELGGSARIKLGDGRIGGLSFLFSNIQSCQTAATTTQLATNNTALLTLDANGEYKRTRLNWVNNTGYKNDFFVIQRLNSEGKFEDIQIVNSFAPSRDLQYFTHYDNSPNEGENVYRIKVDYNDGTVRYSEIKKVNIKGTNDGLVFPNPASDFVDLGLPQFKGKDVYIYIYNTFGQPVLSHTQDNINAPVRLDVSKLNAGNYLIRISAHGKRDMIKTLVITK